MRRFWVALAIFAAVAAAAWLGICRPYTLPMGGMEPTLYRGDKVLVVKRWCDRRLRRGDVVVYDAPIGDDGTGRAAATEQCVARVAAMPGDTIHLDSAMCLTDGDGRQLPYRRMLYAYDSRYDTAVTAMLRRHDFGLCELLGYSGDDFVRALTGDEAHFLRLANPDGLGIRPMHTPQPGRCATVVIPAKGQRIDVTPGNMHLLCQALRRYEDCAAEVAGGRLIVDGREAKALIFGRDYYWLQSENVMDINDSRLCGLMPREALDGRVAVTLFSHSPSQGVRWRRIFSPVQ